MASAILALLLIGGPSGLARSAPIELLLVGDSLTNPRAHNSPGPDRIYAGLLEAWLGDVYDITNAGRGGTTLYAWEAQFAFDAVFSGDPPDVVSVLLGSNDAVGLGLPAPLAIVAYREKMRRFVYKLAVWGAGTIILSTSPRMHEDNPNEAMARDRLRGYRDEDLALCSEFASIVCGPDLHEIIDPDLHLRSDGVHFNVGGHRQAALAFRDTLMSIPEPGTGLLVGAGLLALGLRRRCGERAAAAQRR